MKLEMLLLTSYLVTIAVEIALALLWKIRRRDLAVVLLANTVTNPFVVLVHFICGLYLPHGLVNLPLIVLEPAAWFVEGFVYKRAWQKGNRAYLFSLCANLCSFLGGIAFSAIRHSIIG